jgi:very-short-patch-repair endonuclease
MDPERELAQIAHRQHGLVTRGQALAAGMSARQVTGRLARGRWHLVRRGVYAGGWVPPSWHQAVMAVVLAVGPPCAVSHATAARLWGLPVPVGDGIHLRTPGNRRVALDGVVHHRAERDEVTVHRRMPVTTVARTLVDIGATERVVDDALRRGLVRLDDLAACLDRLDRRGRRRTLGLRELLADRLPGDRPAANDWERWLAAVLRRAGLPAPVRQFPVEVGGRRRYLDLAYPEERIGLEFDGFAEHGLVRSTFDDDRRRDNALRLAGWLVLHFTSRSTPAAIVETVTAALQQRRSA